ncbi:MAG: hypothetical protein QOI92_1225 [Chloroflexota bacterium]|nr:hypothetical protein [Chloroflexota bacterium]
MTALLIRRRRPVGDPAARQFHHGIAGAGRIIQSLGEAGVVLDDDRIQQLLLEPDALLAGLDAALIDERFGRVVLGSHLVNAPDLETRIALLGLARSLAAGGTVFVEHHPVDWLETAADVAATAGGSAGMVAVRVDPPFVSAVSILDIGGRAVRQPFRARVLSDAMLDEALAAAGLRRTGRLNQTWLEAADA